MIDRYSYLRSELAIGLYTLGYVVLLFACTNIYTPDLASHNIHYRSQVSALLQGELALTADPGWMDTDLTYSGGGIQQVWGLGIPAWRIPFTLLSEFMGLPYLPDRIALATALWLWCILILNVLIASPSRPSGQWKLLRGRVAAAFFLLCFPTFFTLLTTKFDIYEEAIAYQYLAATAMFVGLLALGRRPNLRLCLWLSLCAGFAPFIRPTLAFYSIGTIATAYVILRHSRFSQQPFDWRGAGIVRECALLVQIAAPCLIGALLLAYTNWLRFDHPLEFGHSLNLHMDFASMYSTRFGSPFDTASFATAAKELFGLFFLTDELPGRTFWKQGFFPLQSELIRWREIYFHNFNASHFVALLAILVMALSATWKLFRDKNEAELLPTLIAGIRILTPLVGLSSLYLWRSVISSRYIADFAALFAVIFAVLAWRSIGIRSRYWRGFAVCFLVWWAANMAWGWVRYPDTMVDKLHLRERDPADPLPAAYEMGQTVGYPSLNNNRLSRFSRPISNIRYNSIGWDPDTGETKPMAAFFADNIKFVELDIEEYLHGTPEWAARENIRVKVQLEELEFLEEIPIPGGIRLKFSAPKRKLYQHGTQIIFIAFGPPAYMLSNTSPYRLTALRWRED